MKKTTAQHLKLNIRDEFITSMSEKYFWATDDLVPLSEALKLRSYGENLYQGGQFADSKIYNLKEPGAKQTVRGDEIYWIDNWDEPTFKHLKNILEELSLLARRYLYLPAYFFDGHLSVYQAGFGYAAHVDATPLDSRRLLTVVIYLSDLQNSDGGNLVLFDDLARPVQVQPQCGRLVVFDSTMEHKVNPTHKARWSLVVWLCRGENTIRLN